MIVDTETGRNVEALKPPEPVPVGPIEPKSRRGSQEFRQGGFRSVRRYLAHPVTGKYKERHRRGEQDSQR